MVVEGLMLSFGEWFLESAASWAMAVAILATAGVVLGWLVAALRYGPIRAFWKTGRALEAGLMDLVRISPRRVSALAWLAVKESIRRRVLVVFAVFILILLFAGWFLDPGSSHPDELYLSFVLTATSYLVLLLALFLSALSLPEDIKNKTLHTVVTKPVRHSEIVLGRMLGFTVVGTLLLIVMGTISYVFVVRGLAHTHEISEAELTVVDQAVEDPSSAPRAGTTSRVHQHRHDVVVDSDGTARAEMSKGHWHKASIKKSGGKTTYQLGSPQGRLLARVPIYGKLRFKDSSGREAEKGVNTGDEWAYRSFIQGGSLATAVWSFEGITEEAFPREVFPRGLPLEMGLEIFRTTKGDTSDETDIPGTLGSISVVTTTPEIAQLQKLLETLRRRQEEALLAENPQRDMDRTPVAPDAPFEDEIRKIQANLQPLRVKQPPPVEVRIFSAQDFTPDIHYIPFELETPDGRKLDLMKDVIRDGHLEVSLQCIEPMQYFGVAQADAYFRARDASFAVNFAKGYLGIWLQMMLVIGLGVMFSTFLSGPIALVATLGTILGGFFSQFMGRLGSGEILGGGPLESLIRLLTQQNMVTEMAPNFQTRVAKMVDHALQYLLWAASSVLPNFGEFSFADYVAYGFDISPDLLLRCVLHAGAFLLPVFVAGYFFLKLREVAK